INRTICSGKYLILVGGEVAAVEASLAAGMAAGGAAIIDSCLIPNIDPAVFPALCGAAFKNIGVQTVLDAVVDFLPSPSDVGGVVGKDPRDLSKSQKRAPDPDAPLCALAFKIVSDAHGDLTFVRLYSGRLAQGGGVYNPRLGKHERVMRLLRMHANEREPLESVEAGDIVALVGLKETATGDTLCDKKAPIVLEAMSFPEPVMSMRIEPRTNADRDRLNEALSRLAREDPTFRVHVDRETGETIIEGMGELHLEVLTNRLTRDLGVSASVGKPRVAYRQTVAATGEGKATFERLIGSKTHAATVSLLVEPSPGSGGVAVESRARPDQVPQAMAAAVDRGIRGAAQGTAGFAWPAIDVRVTVVGGSPHDQVPPSEIAFEAAGGMAFEKAFEAAKPVLLEPAMRLEVHTPNDFTGEVLADLHRRRAIVEGSEIHGDLRILSGRVPLSAMFGYSTSVRSLTRGRAGYSLEPAGYEPVPEDRARELAL
ncbi:MAG: BMC domain-containing protein, partial [Candidatus Rokubacteria bacterium]|nr:BMC domain-containing protein [Candidatus Rokubacteria bacterium]